MFNEIPVKNPETFLTEIEKSTLSSLGNTKDSQANTKEKQQC
jgi:hypothetical protein